MAQQTPHTIDVVISPEGEIKATVQGVHGSQCGPLSEFLNDLGEVVEDKRTPDYYRQQTVTTTTARKVGK